MFSTTTGAHSSLCCMSAVYIISFNLHNNPELEKCELAYVYFYVGTFVYSNSKTHQGCGREISSQAFSS